MSDVLWVLGLMATVALIVVVVAVSATEIRKRK